MQKIREILKIGIPIMLGQACVIILSFADNIMIGWYGVDDLAASSFVNGIINLFIFTELGFACGLTPVVGSLFGKNDSRGIGAAVKNGLAVNGAVGITGLVVLAIIYAFLDRFGQEPELLPIIRPYFIVVGISTIFALGFNTLKQFSDGICRPVVAMCLLMGGNLLNIFGNWVLIYGKLGFPELGLLGAGLSTLFSRIAMLVVFAAWLMNSKSLKEYYQAFRQSKVSRKGIRRLFSLGYPLALQTGMETSTFTMSAVMAGWLGATTLAAHQVTLTISQICFMLMTGLATAVSVLVSNAYGQNDMKSVRGYASKGYFMILAVSVFFCTAIWLFRFPIVGMFTDSEEVTAIALSLLIVLFTYQFGDGLQLCFCNALRGIQDVKPIMLMAFVSYYLIAIPSAYLLGFKAGLGITGIWMGFPIGLTVAGIFYYIRFRRRTPSR
ncbi:MAG: MATE family efflux transporter [Bacteroidetes bacterium]|uniref:Multidrug-efflux transporter n=1 Tax=Candidatus Cryptobacteroides gallistercoris TaxID=2840765 RepID=A0A940DMR5_9BACT|nr:MATE family efflux transporter [Candidatus Cryptobacteroides gallistercoris]